MSQAIVDFIAHLLPLYVEEVSDGQRRARCLQDGTLVGTSPEMGDEFVSVCWHGDPVRRSTVLATFMASIAVARYVELRYVAEGQRETRAEMAHLSQHFEHKTGETLAFESPPSALMDAALTAAAKLGEDAVKEALKKLAGL
jgi:hypothetical protein